MVKRDFLATSCLNLSRISYFKGERRVHLFTPKKKASIEMRRCGPPWHELRDGLADLLQVVYVTSGVAWMSSEDIHDCMQ